MIMAMCNTISHIFYFQRDKNKAYIRKKQKKYYEKEPFSVNFFIREASSNISGTLQKK